MKSFTTLEACEVHTIKYWRKRKNTHKKSYRRVTKEVDVPIQYARIIHQFLLEDLHGKRDRGHESLRRRTYVDAMLDALGIELDRYHGQPGNFRSRVLNPVLQRQIRGVPDVYAPSIRNAVAPGVEKPTIEQVTSFYFQYDVLDSKFIPSFRRNLVYSREVIWQLSCLCGAFGYGSVPDYDRSIELHDLIMENLQTVGRFTGRGIPPFHAVEVDAIVAYGLEEFFEAELSRTVSCLRIFTRSLTHPTL